MKIKVLSVFDTFEYVMDHYTPVGCEEEAINNDTYAVISIQDTHYDGFGLEFKENEFCKGVLTLYFDDIDKKVKDAVLFDDDMALKIIEFVDKYDGEVDTIVVHCYAGQSRSRAVGGFVNYMVGFDNTELIKYGHPNMFIYKTLMKAYKKWSKNKM